MAEIVLDFVRRFLPLYNLERGGDSVASIMPRSLVSVVNEAEVITVLIRGGKSPDHAVQFVADLPYRRVDLDTLLARELVRCGAM